MNKKHTLLLCLASTMTSFTLQGSEQEKYYSININGKTININASKGRTVEWVKKKFGGKSPKSKKVTILYSEKPYNTASGDDITYPEIKSGVLSKDIETNKQGTLATLESLFEEKEYVVGPGYLLGSIALVEIVEYGKMPSFALRYVCWLGQVLLLLGAVVLSGWAIFRQKATTQPTAKRKNSVKEGRVNN